MNRIPPVADWSRWLFPVALVWLPVAGLLLVELWPDIPRTSQQWALFLAFGPPLYVLGEAVCAWLFAPARGWSTSRKRFSIARIAVALPVALAWFALSWWLASFIAS